MVIQKKKIGYQVLNWNKNLFFSSAEVLIKVEYVTLQW